MSQLVGIAADVARGMWHMESHSYIHRDLAARNVLVDRDLRCKIADFGFTKQIKGYKYTPEGQVQFPVRWTAPEAMKPPNSFSFKTDVWSYGVVLMEIVTFGLKPYPGMKNREVMQKVVRGYRQPQPKGCPDSFYRVARACWMPDPRQRPNFKIALKLIKAVNYPDHLENREHLVDVPLY